MPSSRNVRPCSPDAEKGSQHEDRQCRRPDRGNTGPGRRQAHLRRGRRQPQRPDRRAAQAQARSTGSMSGTRRSPPSPPPAKRRSPASLRSAPARAVPAICISSTACSTRIAAARRCWRSPRRSRRPRSAAAISRRPIRRTCSGNAAIIANWFPIRRSCLTCWRTRSARRWADAASPSSSFPATSRCDRRRSAAFRPNAGLLPAAPIVRPAEAELEALAELLNGAERVTLFCGRGCAGAHDGLMQLAETLKSPIVHALGGKEHVEYDNPYDVGMTGFIGFSSGYAAMHACDVLLMLGTDFPYKQFLPTDAKIAQVDIRPENLGRRCKLDLGLVGDVGATIEALLPKLTAKSDRKHLDDSLAHYKKARAGLDELAQGTPGQKPIHPQYLARLLSEQASDGRGVHGRRRHADDLGGALSRHERPSAPRRFLGPRLDGQRHGARDRRAGRAEGAAGDLDVGRWRVCHADGRPDHADADEAAGEGRDLQQRRAGIRGDGDEGRRLHRDRRRSQESRFRRDGARHGHSCGAGGGSGRALERDPRRAGP